MGRRVDVGHGLGESAMMGSGVDVGSGLGEIVMPCAVSAMRVAAGFEGGGVSSAGAFSSIGAQADRIVTLEIATRSQNLRGEAFMYDISIPLIRISLYISYLTFPVKYAPSADHIRFPFCEKHVHLFRHRSSELRSRRCRASYSAPAFPLRGSWTLRDSRRSWCISRARCWAAHCPRIVNG
jgi:hypothetical protein